MTVDMPREIGWRSRWTATHAAEVGRRHEAEAERAVWEPCSGCWGQRRLLQQEQGGTWTWFACPVCLGIGEVIR